MTPAAVERRDPRRLLSLVVMRQGAHAKLEMMPALGFNLDHGVFRSFQHTRARAR